MSDDIVKLYLEAASVSDRPHTFVVGPYGRRVSFASQQRRALNTVWALEKKEKISPGMRIAVVGGGLAGVMTATALLARQCLVWMFELRPRILELQAYTKHRYIHPTVNFWPDKPISPTTRFPFLPLLKIGWVVW